jgi:molybdopterin adenylyltransferase
MKAAVLAMSTSRSAGQGDDISGPKLRELLEAAGCEVIAVELIPDERELIAGRLRFYADEEGCALIATTGGTGLSRDDVTPEATRDVIDREAPGFAEAMRLASREQVPEHWFLSRGIAGTRNRTLILNFPGNPNAIEQAGAAITGSLEHALGLLKR